MNILLIIVGVLILAAVLLDMFNTIIHLNGAGYLSEALSEFIWKIFFRLAKGDGNNRILNLCGAIILLALIFMWISLIWLGYSLIFISDINSVINTRFDTPASIVEKVYYVGYTLTSLGNGGFRAGSHVWEIISNAMGFSSMIFISLGISYLLPVLKAVVDKRTLAVYISGLGETPEEIIKNGFNGNNFRLLYSRFTSIETLILNHAERHLAYPILHYFHSNSKTHSTSLNLTALDEAITIQEIYKIDTSEENYNWQVLRKALKDFYNRLDRESFYSVEEVPPFDYHTQLSKDFPDIKFKHAEGDIHKYDEHRKKILGYIEKDGWKWEDVIT